MKTKCNYFEPHARAEPACNYCTIGQREVATPIAEGGSPSNRGSHLLGGFETLPCRPGSDGWVVLIKGLLTWGVICGGGFASGNAQETTAPDFVVSGKATHQQFGKFAFVHQYTFTARASGTNWSLSVITPSDSVIDRFLAAGNDKDAFVTLDFSRHIRARRAAGHQMGQNESEAVVLSNGVPSMIHTPPVVGTIWLTYLSAGLLKQANPDRFPVPVTCNVVSGNYVAPLAYYFQVARWVAHPDTGLPDRFVSLDDGIHKEYYGNTLVRLGPYPKPYDRGFTNIVFSVHSYKKFRDWQLPAEANLEVWWLPINGRALERVHSCTVIAESFADPPAAPVPPPLPVGIARIADLRLGTSNGPIVLHYTSNRFLDRGELLQLPNYAQAVRESLEIHQVRIVKPRSPYLFWALAGLATLGAAALFVFQWHRRNLADRSTTSP